MSPSSTSAPLKSILKKSTAPTKRSPLSQTTSISDPVTVDFSAPSSSSPHPTTTSSTGPSRDPAALRALALSRAQSIQLQKSLSSSILSSILYLLDLSPTNPRAASIFKHHLRFFTPGDYDSLLEERNICDLCGYVLCSNPPAKVAGGGRVKMVDHGRKFVEKKKLERFCTRECARRALWVRVQLAAEPAWVRGEVVATAQVDEKGVVSGVDLESEEPGEDGGWEGVVLWDERETVREKEEERERVERELRKVGIERLRMERGEEEGGVAKVLVDVKEKVEPTVKFEAPSLEEEEDGGVLDEAERRLRALRIEGYEVKIGGVGGKKGENSDEDDE